MNFKLAREKFRQFADFRRQQEREQIGEGVVTRKQAKLAESVPTETSLKLPEPAHKDESDNEQVQEQQIPHENISDDPKSDIEEVTEESKPEAQPQDSLFNHETLVAENSALEAYVIKVFFKRQKRFQ